MPTLPRLQKRWLVGQRDPAAEARLSAELGLSPLLSAVLISRGHSDPAAANKFLNPTLDDLNDPKLLPDYEAAKNEILGALERKETIFIHGDYDVDGVTSAALFSRFLTKIGCHVVTHVPHRMKEGYGIHSSAVDAAVAAGAKLFLTCDCGGSAIEQVERARAPSKNIPAVVERLTERFVSDRRDDERFQSFCQRIGKKALKEMLDEFIKVPAHGEDPSYYSDWGDPREYTTGDMGTGECAGEVVSVVEFDLADAEREVFEAQILLEAGDNQQAEARAYHAMLKAARALLRTQGDDVGDDGPRIVTAFKARFVDTELFDKEFASGKFAHYLLRHHEVKGRTATAESAHQLIEEASLFVEASHACQIRLSRQKAPAVSRPVPTLSLESLA